MLVVLVSMLTLNFVSAQAVSAQACRLSNDAPNCQGVTNSAESCNRVISSINEYNGDCGNQRIEITYNANRAISCGAESDFRIHRWDGSNWILADNNIDQSGALRDRTVRVAVINQQGRYAVLASNSCVQAARCGAGVSSFVSQSTVQADNDPDNDVTFNVCFGEATTPPTPSTCSATNLAGCTTRSACLAFYERGARWDHTNNGCVSCRSASIGTNVNVGTNICAAEQRIDTCTDSGWSIGTASCTTPQICSNGQCVATTPPPTLVCTAGQYRCSGNMRQQCSSGAWVDSPCASGLSCTGSGGCVPPEGPPTEFTGTSVWERANLINALGIREDDSVSNLNILPVSEVDNIVTGYIENNKLHILVYTGSLMKLYTKNLNSGDWEDLVENVVNEWNLIDNPTIRLAEVGNQNKITRTELQKSLAYSDGTNIYFVVYEGVNNLWLYSRPLDDNDVWRPRLNLLFAWRDSGQLPTQANMPIQAIESNILAMQDFAPSESPQIIP